MTSGVVNRFAQRRMNDEVNAMNARVGFRLQSAPRGQLLWGVCLLLAALCPESASARKNVSCGESELFTITLTSDTSGCDQSAVFTVDNRCDESGVFVIDNRSVGTAAEQE